MSSSDNTKQLEDILLKFSSKTYDADYEGDDSLSEKAFQEALTQLQKIMIQERIDELRRIWPLKEGEIHHEIRERNSELQAQLTNHKEKL